MPQKVTKESQYQTLSGGGMRVQLNKEKISEYKNGIHLMSLDTIFVPLFMTYGIISE